MAFLVDDQVVIENDAEAANQWFQTGLDKRVEHEKRISAVFDIAADFLYLA